MGWFRGKLFRSRSVGAAPVGVCDSCNAELSRRDGYFLRTRDVVLSEAYWIHNFTHAKQAADWFGVTDETRLLRVFQSHVRGAAGQQSPWLICENCSELFVFDRDAARSHALDNSEPPGMGRVDPSECLPFAAAAWERVFGYWPA